jgi:hypothetical protein
MHPTLPVPGSRFVSRAAVCGITLGLLATLAGCGGSDPKTPPGNLAEGTLMPFKTGNSWTYRVSDGTTVSEKTTTIGKLETIGGTGPHAADMAFNVVTRKGMDLADQTISWQAPSVDDPERIVRYREIGYGATTQMPKLETHWDPEKLHIDGRKEILVDGKTWLEHYGETKTTFDELLPVSTMETDSWTVLSVDVTVTAADVAYEHTVHFQKVSGSGARKEYWYKPDVGKIKETGTQTEELVSSDLK